MKKDKGTTINDCNIPSKDSKIKSLFSQLKDDK